jgi:hypothetical protein
MFLKQYYYVSKITKFINWKVYFPTKNSVSFLKENQGKNINKNC